jgi:hypothetical protein
MTNNKLTGKRLEEIANTDAWVKCTHGEVQEMASLLLAIRAPVEMLAAALRNAPLAPTDSQGRLRTPAVPVQAVPDEVTVEAIYPDVQTGWNDAKMYADGWNACRAAMLQGAEPVTTANKLPFEQWLSQQTGTIDVECGCVMTEVFFHWLRVAYEAGNSPVIPDGWVACSERMPENNLRVLIFRSDICHIATYHSHKTKTRPNGRWHSGGKEYHYPVTHWMPLPAAPQNKP